MTSGLSNLEVVASRLRAEGDKILIFQTAFLGDVILATPIIQALRAHFPLTKLGAVVIPAAREILVGQVDRIHTIDKQSRDATVDWKRLREELREERYAFAIVPHRSYRTAKFLQSTQIPIRIGFNRGPGRFKHTIRIPYDHWKYEGARNLDLLVPLGLVGDDPFPKLAIPNETESKVGELLREIGVVGQRFAVIAPGSVWETKRWPSSHFKMLAKLLEQAGLRVLIIGGKTDLPATSESATITSVNLAGRLSMLESAEIIRRSVVSISGDSAPAHLATAVGARQLIILGSTAPRFGFVPDHKGVKTLGSDLWCRPCSDHGRQKCPRFGSPHCLVEITPEQVFEAVKELLSCTE